jgi:hypothetical protein
VAGSNTFCVEEDNKKLLLEKCIILSEKLQT